MKGGNPTGTHSLFSKLGLLVARRTSADMVERPERGGWSAPTPGESCISSSISSITCNGRETKMRPRSSCSVIFSRVSGPDLLGGQEWLLGEAGDDDGVHVQLLPQLLLVRRLLGSDCDPPLVRDRPGGGKLIKALNPSATSIGRFVPRFWGG